MDDYKETLTKNVSRETFLKIEGYKEALQRWNRAFNLTRFSDEEFYREALEALWATQILNSFDGNNFYDIGSGNGMPGVILSIAGIANLTLVERNFKKFVFLNELKNELALQYSVINIDATNLNIANSSIITSKAVTSVAGLLALVKHKISHIKTIVLFKNRSQEGELEIAKQKFTFKSEVLENKYINDKVVFVLSDISPNK